MRISLNGRWQMRATDQTEYLEAVVPGCQFLDLMRAGVIPDPFVGTGERDVQWVHDKDFEYRRTFVLGAEDVAADGIDLVCKTLDTIADVYLNGCLVGRADNCHRAHVYDVKAAVRVGENVLSILFASPKRYVERKYRETPTPPNCNGQNGIVHIRKPQCHFGWDWGPVLTPVGISGDVYLEMTYGRRLGDLAVRVDKTATGFAVAAEAAGADAIRITYPDGRTFCAAGEAATFDIDDPMLWWTAELSGSREQPLYTVEATAAAGGDVQTKVRRVGLRTISLNREKDAYGYNFQFVLNGVPLFVKGANYIPPDSFMTRFDHARLDAMLDAVQFADMNMIRVWGGGYYADDALLDACDRRGILVWQDCMFACQAYPFFDDDFRNNVLDEIAYNVRRISSHPSLALWCGNNEIEDMHLAWATMRQYVEWTERFFYHILPEHIAAIDDRTPYTPGSPVGLAHNHGTGDDYVGDTHLWGVWHGLKPMTYYRHRMTRFCSEFGFESLPSFRTVKTYAEPKDYPLRSPVQRAHQKCAHGNDKMLYYIASRFRLSPDVEDLIYLSQVTQERCIADATEHWRRHKGRCNGAIYWQLNDCWPTCSWSSYDYLGEYKALQYSARRFNAPLSVSLEDDKRTLKVYILNDLTADQTVEVAWYVFDFDHTYPPKSRQTFTVPALENLLAYTIDLSDVDARHQGIAVRLYLCGQCIMQKTHLLLPEKKLRLPLSAVDVSEEIEEGKRKITLTSSHYQRLVMLCNEYAAPFSDNFFDLLPGETKTVYQDAPLGAPTTLRSVATLRKASRLRSALARVKVFLSPRNVANALYHGRIPHPYHED